MMVGVYEEDFPTWQGLETDYGYREPGRASEQQGGPKGQAAAILGLEIGRRDPPVVTLTSFRSLRLTMGSVYYDVETGDDNRLRAE